jgi:transcriptional regulator with XRE-family HTH domain
MTTPTLPSAERALKYLGINVSKARRRRRWTCQDFADQMGVSLSTARRLEKGEGGVALHTLIRAVQVLGMLEDFNRLLDADRDAMGHLLRDQLLPQRVRHASTGLRA